MLTRPLVVILIILFFISLHQVVLADSDDTDDADEETKRIDTETACDDASSGIQKCRDQAKAKLNTTTDIKARCTIKWNRTLCAIKAACDSCGIIFPLVEPYEWTLKHFWVDDYPECIQWFDSYEYANEKYCIAWTFIYIMLGVIGVPLLICCCVCLGVIIYHFTHKSTSKGKILGGPGGGPKWGQPQSKMAAIGTKQSVVRSAV